MRELVKAYLMRLLNERSSQIPNTPIQGPTNDELSTVHQTPKKRGRRPANGGIAAGEETFGEGTVSESSGPASSAKKRSAKKTLTKIQPHKIPVKEDPFEVYTKRIFKKKAETTRQFAIAREQVKKIQKMLATAKKSLKESYDQMTYGYMNVDSDEDGSIQGDAFMDGE